MISYDLSRSDSNSVRGESIDMSSSSEYQLLWGDPDPSNFNEKSLWSAKNCLDGEHVV